MSSMTVTEFARKGNQAMRAKYSAKQLREWAKRGGRPKGSKNKRNLTKSVKRRAA